MAIFNYVRNRTVESIKTLLKAIYPNIKFNFSGKIGKPVIILNKDTNE